MKKILLPLLLLLSAKGFAQVNTEDLHIFDNKNPNKTEIKSSPNLNPLTIDRQQILDEFLSRNSYQDFFEAIKSYKLKDQDYIKYLESKKDEGHIPLYWLMADYYAKKVEPKETHKWLYIATIMTQQDSYLCYDNTARNAPRILLRSFPETIELTRKTPQFIQATMSDVFFFIYNLKQRISPEWVCRYGETTLIKNNDIVLPKKDWNIKRQEVLKRFSDKYMN